MILIGIDPGSKHCGYGILEVQKRKIIAAGCDVIHLNPALLLAERIVTVFEALNDVLDQYKPDMAAVETIFYGKNIQSSFTLAQFRGAILLNLAQRKIPIIDYSPREIKKSVVGNGNASKVQVKYMVQQLIPLSKFPDSQDAIDALAAAICLFNRLPLGT